MSKDGKEQPSREGSTNRHVYVEPGVQIDFVKDIRETYITAQTDNSTHNDKQLFWAKVAAGLIFVYASISFWQGCETQKLAAIGERGSRPFVGIHGSAMEHQMVDDIGQERTTPKPTNKSVSGVFEVEVKNFGPLPAYNFETRWKVFMDNVAVEDQRHPTIVPGVLFPGETINLRGEFMGDDYTTIMRGTKILTLEITIMYDGPGFHEEDCKKSQYSPRMNGFFNLGNCGK